MAIVNIDPFDILRAYMAVSNFMEQQKERKWAPTAEFVGKQGFEAGEQQFGTGKMYDFYKYLFGQEPPQRTTAQVTKPLEEGGVPQIQTKRVWPFQPTLTPEEQQLSLKRKADIIPSAEAELGHEEWKTGFEFQKKKLAEQEEKSKALQIRQEQKDLMSLGKRIDPTGKESKLTKEEALTEATKIVDSLYGGQPYAGASDITYGKEYKVTPHKVTKYTKIKGVEHEYDVWQSFDEQGKLLHEMPISDSLRLRFKEGEKGKLTEKDYANYDFKIVDDSKAMAVRELFSRGAMKMVQDPVSGQMTAQFAVPAEQGDKLFKEAFSKHYKEGVKRGKSQGYLPSTWKETPFGEEEAKPTSPIIPQGTNFMQWFMQQRSGQGAQPFKPAESEKPTPKSKILTREIAKQILEEAGGDKDKARKLAKERGYKF